jgi:subtilisin family serine protease
MFATALAVVALVVTPFARFGERGPDMLVQLEPAAACSEAAALVSAGANTVAPELQLYRLDGAATARVTPTLRARHALRSVTRDRPAGTLATHQATDPLLPQQWWRTAIGIEGLTPPGPGKPITVVDSGINVSHPEFAGRPNLSALNPQEPGPLGGEHGTQVASLVGAPANGVGTVGIYPDSVLRSWDAALGEGRQLTTGEIVAGIVAAARGGPGVINLSLGGPRDDVIEQAVGEAWADGSLIVAAAGNDGDAGSPLTYPAALPHVLTVGATDRTNTAASFTSASRFVDLAAPGQGVLVASARQGGWIESSGTSFASPLVAGAAAWVWTVRQDLDNSQLFEVMRRSARDIGAPGRDLQSGFGLLNVAGALTFAAPARDPLEPNEDVDFVKPGGFFETGQGPLTTPGRERASIGARLDRNEDPRDVYRVFAPARRELVVTATGLPDVDLSVWKPNTSSLTRASSTDRLAVSARPGRAPERVVVKSANAGRWLFVAVGPGRSTEASYQLTVASRAPVARR